MGHSGEIGTRLASFFVLRRWYNKPKVRSEARSRNPMIPPTTAPIVVFVGKDVFDLSFKKVSNEQKDCDEHIRWPMRRVLQ